MLWLDVANEPEENIDIKEKEYVGQEKRMLKAPLPQRE